MNKEYIMSRLNAGESLQEIGDSFAQLMNEANAEYMEAKRKEEEAAARAESIKEAKRTIAQDMVNLVAEYFELGGLDLASFDEVGISDLDVVVESLDEMVDLAKNLQDLKDFLKPAVKKVDKPKSDHEILRDFILTL